MAARPRPRFPLVGRARERATLARAMARAQHGPAVVHLVGEPGLGKTRLLEQLAADAGAGGAAVTVTRTRERERHVPYATLRDVLDGLPLPLSLDDVDVPGPDTGRRLTRQIRDLLESGDTRPSVLAVDDAHWADEASTDVVARLHAHLPRVPVLLVLAYRPRPDPGLLAIATRWQDDERVSLVELPPLDESDVRSLLDDLSPARRAEIVGAARGNPFYLDALVRGGDAATPGAGWRAVLQREMAALRPPARATARAAAVAGDPFDVGLVVDLVRRAPAEVHADLDDLVRNDLCRPAALPGQLRFRHELVRQACLDDAGPVDLLAMHSRAAEVLGARGAPLEVRAAHVERSAAPGDTSASELLSGAAAAVERTAPLTAAHWYAQALRIDPAAPPERRGRLLLAGANALTAGGRIEQARAVAHVAVDTLPPGPGRADAVAAAALCEELLGRHDEAAALLRRELARCAPGDVESATTLRTRLLGTALMRGDFAASGEEADVLRQVLPPDAPPGVQATVAASVALAASAAGDVAEAMRRLDVAAAGIDALTDEELARSLEAALWCGWCEMFLERYTHALRHLGRALAIASRGAHSHLLTHLLVGIGSAQKMTGDLDSAAATFDDAADAAERSASAELQTMALAMQCRIATWRGEAARALALGERAVATAGAVPDWFAGVARAVRGQARLVNGDPAGCVHDVLAAGGGPLLPRIDPATRADWYELLTAASLGDGDSPAAAGWASSAAAAAAAGSLTGARGFALLARARVAGARGDAADAASAALAAAAAFESVGDPLDAARARLVAGRALVAVADRAGAREQLQRAEATFAACGAAGLREESVAELRRLGHRLPARPRGPAAAPGRLETLSDREREVAAHVSAGLSNREIAAALFLSEKTVESHLSHIFTKLGVSSRAAVAALAAPMTADRPHG